MKKTQLLLFCFGVMFFLTSAHAQTGSEKIMLLKLNGAEDISVSLKKVPQYWLKGDYLFLKTPDEVRQFEVGSVKEIVFQDSGHASSPLMSQEQTAVYPTLTTDYVYVKVFLGENVQIVASNGQLMPVRAVLHDGALQLNVAEFPMGIYYVLCGGKSYKFIKGQNVN